MFETRLLNVDANPPTPVPLLVLLFAVVGFGEVLQHTPLAVTVAPPALFTVPPLVAEVAVIFEIAVVVTVGIVAFAIVVKEISLP